MDLNLDNLIHILSRANPLERVIDDRNAEAQLKKWESEPGYHYNLQSIYLNLELPLQIRWLAVICLKNGIDRHWRSSRVNAISKQEKVQIKNRLFTLIDEKNNSLMLQIAYLIGKIVRFDFPLEWPNLFEELEKNLHDFVFIKQDITCTNNLLLILNQVIKSLSAVRIGRARHALQSKAPLIVPILVKLYMKFFNDWARGGDIIMMEICYLCLKNLRRIIPEGFEHMDSNRDINEFLNISVDHLEYLIDNYDKYPTDLIERYGKCYSKLYFNILNTNPISFVLLPSCNKILSYYLNYLQVHCQKIYQSTEENDFWEIIGLKAFQILKKLIKYIYNKGAITLKQPKDKIQVENSIKKLTSEFFTSQFIEKLCDLIINWYLPLKPSDLESWQSEPEEWCNEDFQSSWEYQIRHCAENFFQDLVKYFKDDLSNYILGKISGNLNDDSILIQDSILCTFQLSNDSIGDKVDFNHLLTNTFIPLGLKNDNVENKVLKRRVCLIINEWVKIDCSKDSKLAIYKFLNHLLDDSNKISDQVVKLNAIQCSRTMVEDWEFDKKDFKPYLTNYITQFIKLLDEMTFTESKLYILNSVAIIIDKCNPHINYDVLLSLLSIIPKYWDISNSNDNEMILKTSLIRVLKSLVISLNENSPETYSISIPLIRASCQPGDQYLLLSEDGYDLWLSLLQFSPSHHKDHVEIMQLFELVPYGLMNSTEILPVILSIVRSYALLAPEIFQMDFGDEVFKIFSGYLNTLRDDSFVVFISSMDILLLKLNTNENFLTILVNSGLINSLVSYVIDPNQSYLNINKVLLILSRLAFGNCDALFKILNYLSNDLSTFMNSWLQYYSNNGNPRNKKMNLLGLLALLKVAIPIGDKLFIRVFPDIIKKCLLFLEEIQETNGLVDAYQLDFLYEDIDDYRYLDPEIKENGEKHRYVELINTYDPGLKVQLNGYLMETINSIKQGIPPTDFNQLMSLNDEYAIEQLQKLIN